MESSYVTNVGACIIIIRTYSYLWEDGVYGHNYFHFRDLVPLMGIIAQEVFFVLLLFYKKTSNSSLLTLFSMYQIPCRVRTFHALSHLIMMITGAVALLRPHFTDKETEAIVLQSHT